MQSIEKVQTEMRSLKKGFSRLPPLAWLGIAGGLIAYFAVSTRVAQKVVNAVTTTVLGKVRTWDLGLNKYVYRPLVDNIRLAAPLSEAIWTAVKGAVQSNEWNRAGRLLSQVIDQFSVANNPRYAARSDTTFCNIFVQDVLLAMDVILPVGSANSLYDWLLAKGASDGWVKTGPLDAQAAANRGEPAIVIWKNPVGHGHVAILRPGEVTAGGPVIAQSGATNFSTGTVAKGFGTSKLSQVLYYVHS